MIIKDIIKNVPLVLNINLLSGGVALSQSDVFCQDWLWIE